MSRFRYYEQYMGKDGKAHKTATKIFNEPQLRKLNYSPSEIAYFKSGTGEHGDAIGQNRWMQIKWLKPKSHRGK